MRSRAGFRARIEALRWKADAKPEVVPRFQTPSVRKDRGRFLICTRFGAAKEEGVDTEEKSFGEKLPGICYRERPGAYGVAFDSDGRTAVVKVTGKDGGYFLLGGGLEGTETHARCIRRECLEEVGRSVTVGAPICTGHEYIWSDKAGGWLHVIGSCFHMEVGELISDDSESDHELLWLPVEKCVREMFLQYQAWAISLAWEKERKKQHDSL
mgnify:FL=1